MPTKTQLIRFGSLQPDQGEVDNSSDTGAGLVRNHNVINYSGATVPVYGHTDLSDKSTSPGAAATNGSGFCASTGDWSYIAYTFCGRPDVADGLISEWDTTSSPWGETNRSSGGQLSDDIRAQFTQFGTHVLVAMGWGTALQWLENAAHPVSGSRPAAGVKFSGVISTFPSPDGSSAGATSVSAYNPKFVTPIDERILIGNIRETNNGGTATVYHPNRVHWSGTDDPTTFVDPTVNEAVLSDYQDILDDYGTIQGICGAGDYALIFKSRAIYRMTPHPSFQYAFQPIKVGFGTRFCNSIVRVDRDVYFWGPGGPCVYYGANGQVRDLGAGRVSRSILDVSWIPGTDLSAPSDAGLACGAHDVSNGTVSWLVSNGKLLSYSYVSDAFSTIDLDTVFVIGVDTKIPFVFSNPDTGDAFVPLRDLLFLKFYSDGGAYSYAIAGSTAGTGTVAAGDVAFRTGYIEIVPGQRSKINRVRLVWTLNSGATARPAITVNVYSREYPADTGTVTTTGTFAASADKMGYIALPGCPYRGWHQFEILIDDVNRKNVAEIEGIQIELETGGTR